MNTFKTLLYMGTLHGFFTFYFPHRLASLDTPLIDPGSFRFIALPFWMIGTLIIIWCSVDFVRKGRGTPAHADPPRQLVVTGLYRYVRNPIYVGALLVQLGYVIWSGSRIMLVYLLFFFLAYYILVLLIEEPILRNTFGAVYEDYCQRVPRWIPKLRS